ncbi:hypothetical protein IWW42_002745 [Coemansia sp. RSA 1085]|nr:hypothetical protein IWW42_002745 [Coemansia sp. RSA 1085]
MAPGNERSRAEPSKSKSRPFISLGQSLRRGLTTRRSSKNAAQPQPQPQGESPASSPSAPETAGPAADRKHATVSAGTAHSMGMHSTLSKSSYKPSPLSRNGPTGSSSNAASLGLGSSSEASGSSSIYGNGRAQRIASASGVALPPPGMAGAGGHSGGSTHFRKTLYGSTALAGLSKSGYNSSSTSLGGTGPGTGTATNTAGGSSSGPNSGAKSDAPTLGRKAPPPPSEAANSGPQNATNRDYSFAIASNHHANVVSQSARSSAGTSITVTKEGYLSKKTDINPSTSLASALSRGWKVYRVVLKGAKLFFYKPPSESELREMFPEEIAAATNETAGGYFRTSMSVSAHDDAGSSAAGFPMAPGEVESGSRAVLFEPGVRDGEITAPLCERYSFGECFTEVDLRSLKFKRYVCVLIFDDTIVVLKRRWVRQGLASSFFGAVSNKMRFGKSSRAKAQQATDNTSLVSAELGITGKGYFTKWKYHSQYPLANVEAIEAASSRFSVTHSPGVLGHLGRESQAGSSRLSLYSIGNSSVSSVMTRTSTVSKDYSGALSSGLVPGFQIFVNGKERVARMFVATTSDAKNNWLSRFAAAKSSYARRLRQRPRENTGGGRRYNGGTEPTRPATATQSKDQNADAAHAEDKAKQQKDTRTRLFWGTQRHPELVVAAPESSDADTPAENAVVVGGSKSALVHEMIFRTAEQTASDSTDKPAQLDLFSSRLVGTYPLMMTHSEFLSELQRYAGLVTPETPDYADIASHLGNIIMALATCYATVYDAEQIEILRSIVSQSIKADSDDSAASQINAAIDRMVPIAAAPPAPVAAAAEDAGRTQTVEGNSDAALPQSPSVNLDSYEIIGTLSSATAPKQSTDGSMRPLRGRSKTHHGDALPIVPQIPSVPELIRVEITGLSPSMLLRIAPAEFAHQLYLFHKSQLADFNPKQTQLYLPLPPASLRQDANGVRQPTPSLLTVGAAAAACEVDGSPHGATGSQTRGCDSNGAAGTGLNGEAALHAHLQMQRQLMVFTHGEPHFITRMIHHQLLVELPLNRPARRSALLQHWVRIGEEARIIGDAITWAAVAMAITMAPIARLRETWHGVGVFWKDLIVTEWVPLLISHGIYEVDIDVPGRTAGSRPLVIRPQNKSGASTPSASMSYNYTSIPFYGPIRMHIARRGKRLQQTYQRVMAASGTANSDQSERLLFAHFGFMYSAAQEAASEIPSSVVERARTSIMRSRASSVSLASKFQQQGVSQNASNAKRASGDASGQRESVPSNVPTTNVLDVAMQGHPYLQAYLQGLAQNPLKIGDELVDADVMNYDVRYLLSVSLQCEPAVGDQYQQHLPPDSGDSSEDSGQVHALVPLSLRQAPGSILPLVCPETVPSTNILQWITPAVRTPAAAAQTVGRSNGPGGRAGTFSHASESTAASDTADSKAPSRTTMQSESASSATSEAREQQKPPAVKHKRSRSFPANGSTGMQMDGDGGETAEDAAAECDALFAGTTVYAANGDLALRVLRVQHGIMEKTETAPAKRQLRFVVEVQGGTQPILLDLLVNGIAHYSAGLANEKGTPVQVPAGSAGISLVFNRDVYQRTFLASFRHFGGALEVIDSMRRSLSQCSGQAWNETSGSLVSLVDVCENWLSQHFADFLDSTAVREAMAEFIVELQQMMQSQKTAGAQNTWNDLQERVGLLGPDLVTQLLTPSGFTELDRVLDRRLEIAMGRERRTSATAADAQVDTKQAPMSLLSVAEADELLVALNRLAQTHFARCSYNDWLVAFCLLEVQTYMPLPWYAKKRLAHLPPEEELVISDIYQVLEQTQRGRGTAQARDMAGGVVGGGLGSATASFSTETSLVRTLPQSIQTMLELHRTIRGWAIRQIADPSLTLAQRVARIQRFLSLIRLCRKDSHLSTSRVFGTLLNGYMREAAMIPERQPSYRANSVKRYSNSRVAEGGGRRGRRRGQAQTQNKYVPSFVERAIASALVGPESRLYVRAWNTVAAENNTKLDTLEAVLRGARSWAAFETAVPASPQAEAPEKLLSEKEAEEGDAPRPVAVQRSRSNPAADSMDISEDSMTRADCFVPCVGWLLENMISLCYDTPDTFVSDARLVNLAKRHRVFIMLCVCDQLVSRCQEALALPTRARIDLAQLNSWIAQNPLRASEIQQTAQKELALPTPEAAPVQPPAQGGAGFARPGDTMTPQTLRQGHSASFAKRSIANLRSVASGPANDQRASGFHPRRSTAVEFGAGGGQVFGSPPAPAPRSLAYGEVPGAPGAGAASGPGNVYVHPFVRLVTDEVEKVRQEIRERERLERELRDREQAIERQKNERTKMLKRQLKEQQQRRAKNEPLLKMANLMNKVGISTRDSSIDGGSNVGSNALNSGADGPGAATGSVYGGLPEAAGAELPDGSGSSRLSGVNRPRGPALPSAKPANVINLINSTITVEQAYTKRDYVFRIITEEGGQYLLQAPDQDQMEDWMSAMRDAATEAAARRLTLFVEEAKKRSNNDNAATPPMPTATGESDHGRHQLGSETTRSRFTAFLGAGSSAFGAFGLSSQQSSAHSRGALPLHNQHQQQQQQQQASNKEPAVTTEPKTFGVELTQQMPDPQVVPAIVEKCLTEIELRGLEEVGIYRVSGAAADVSRLRALFNADPDAVDLGSGDFPDINVVSGVMKQFLRELPEPIMTFGLYDGFINAASIDDYDERLWAIKDLVHALPAPNYTVLKRLVEHLERVTDYEEVNHMYGTNLALVFGPSLLRPPPGSSSFALAMSNLGHAQSVIKNLILQYHWIFNVEEEAEPLEDDDNAALPSSSQLAASPSAVSVAPVDGVDKKPTADSANEEDDDDVPLAVAKRESVAASLSPTSQADMDQLTAAVNKMSVSP